MAQGLYQAQQNPLGCHRLLPSLQCLSRLEPGLTHWHWLNLERSQLEPIKLEPFKIQFPQLGTQSQPFQNQVP